MAMAVNSNSTVFTVFTHYTYNIDKMKKSMSRLSTGTRTVIDDPSGVGISERMRAQIRSSAMSRNNVENGLSLLQTAEAWLQKISDMLSRMQELAVEANDGTKSQNDIDNVQEEFKELQTEITRITSRNAAAAKYNGLFLFRGGNGRGIRLGDAINTGSITIHIGPDLGQQMHLELNDLQVNNTQAIGTVSTYTYSSNNSVKGSTHTTVTWASVIDSEKMSVTSTSTVGKISKAIDHVADSRADLGAQQSHLVETRSGLMTYESNLRSAESKIRDVDIARESTKFAKNQILVQVGTAMLAQAQRLPEMAMQLLG